MTIFFVSLLLIVCNIDYFTTVSFRTNPAALFAVCRYDATQRANDVMVSVKKKLQQNPECMSAIAKIVVHLLLCSDDSSKVTKPLIQVNVQLYCANCILIMKF